MSLIFAEGETSSHAQAGILEGLGFTLKLAQDSGLFSLYANGVFCFAEETP